MQPLDLIKTARRLSDPRGSKKPRQSDLKRAVSTAYYAIFHTLCRNCADCLIGKTKASRSEPAWRQAYRAVEHSHAKNQCKNKAILAKFPQDIQNFAELFTALQEKRHAADYDPLSRFDKLEANGMADAAERAINRFHKANIKDRRAFAAWTAMKTRNNRAPASVHSRTTFSYAATTSRVSAPTSKPYSPIRPTGVTSAAVPVSQHCSTLPALPAGCGAHAPQPRALAAVR